MELSGSTVANWVHKTANLLTDAFGGPDRVGLLLPLHWQTVCFLLGGVAADATVVLARQPSELAGCEVAFVSAGHVEAALDAGVEDVLAVSGHPLGARVTTLPPMVLDAAAEVPGHGDHFGGPFPVTTRIEVEGRPYSSPPELGVGAGDRVLTTLEPSTSAGLDVLLAALAAGAGLVLLTAATGGPAVAALAAAEQVTVTAGLDVPGLRRLA